MPLLFSRPRIFTFGPPAIGVSPNCQNCCCDGSCCFCQGYNQYTQWDAAYQFDVVADIADPLVIFPTCSDANCLTASGTWPATPSLCGATGPLVDQDTSAGVCCWSTTAGSACGARCYFTCFYKNMSGHLIARMGRSAAFLGVGQTWYEDVLVSETYNIDCDAIDIEATSFTDYRHSGGNPDPCSKPISIRFSSVP
jgi:hypothetical protein